MKKLLVLSLFCLFAYSVTAGCVATVSVPPPEPVVYVPAPAPVAVVAVAAPPPIEIQEPEMVVVPSGNEYVYMVPNVAGVYFYGGGWYRYYGGGWFRASVWGAPWVGIAIAPPVVVAIDPFYPFYLPVGYFRIGWGDFHGHWRSWGSSRHWHNNPYFRNEMRADVRSARMNQIRADRSRGIDRSKMGSTRGTAGSRTFKSSGTVKGSSTLKGSATFKGSRTFKGSGTVKGASTLKGAQTLKRTQTMKAVQKGSGQAHFQKGDAHK